MQSFAVFSLAVSPSQAFWLEKGDGGMPEAWCLPNEALSCLHLLLANHSGIYRYQWCVISVLSNIRGIHLGTQAEKHGDNIIVAIVGWCLFCVKHPAKYSPYVASYSPVSVMYIVLLSMFHRGETEAWAKWKKWPSDLALPNSDLSSKPLGPSPP